MNKTRHILDNCERLDFGWNNSRVYFLTLINMEEGFSQFAGEQRLGKISEELLDHVSYVVGGLVLVIHVLRGVLVHLPESLDARFDPGLAEKTHLEVIKDSINCKDLCGGLGKPICIYFGKKNKKKKRSTEGENFV